MYLRIAVVFTLYFCGVYCFKSTPELKKLTVALNSTVIDPDAYLDVVGLITSKGYPAEQYHVQTSDGYILGVQRIPLKNGLRKTPWNCQPVKKGTPILLQHGLMSSAADYVMNYPNQSLGFILSDCGYDVWLGNIRGNTYSRNHVNISVKSKEFWQYSFDEMAQYDLSAMIDFILNKTGFPQLYYVGHSQGTSMGFALLSESPEYNKKVKAFIALAPVATVENIKSPIRYIAPFSNNLEKIFEWFGYYDFLPNSVIIKILADTVCDSSIRVLCEEVIFLLCGVDPAQLNTTRIPVYVNHSPAGTSVQSVVHYGQMVENKKFIKFDYGKDKNMQKYGQPTPPEYQIENITAPVALFWSLNDWLADVSDVARLVPRIKNLVTDYRVSFPKFSHLDFVWGMDAATLVYKEVLATLQKV